MIKCSEKVVPAVYKTKHDLFGYHSNMTTLKLYMESPSMEYCCIGENREAYRYLKIFLSSLRHTLESLARGELGLGADA